VKVVLASEGQPSSGATVGSAGSVIDVVGG
jgi:hypothetical protein